MATPVRRFHWHRLPQLLLCALVGVGCDDDAWSNRPTQQPDAGNPGYPSRPPRTDGGGGLPTWDGSLPDSQVPPGLEECATVTAEGRRIVHPADIIWVIDSSTSMEGEARIVQQNMNTFADMFSGAEIDVRVVVITDASYVNVPPPLGDNQDRYRFIDRHVASNDALQALLDEFDGYEDFIRSDSRVHFVAVTDDESDLSATDFRDSMRGLVGRDFVAHGIASPSFFFAPCFGPNGDAAAIGRQYKRLAEATEGQFFSICTSDWQELFNTLGEAVVESAALECTYEIPPVPEEVQVSPDAVNVVASDAEGETETLPRTAGPDSCGENKTWYFNDPDQPTQVHLCPLGCAELNNQAHSTIEIVFGCETVEEELI